MKRLCAILLLSALAACGRQSTPAATAPAGYEIFVTNELSNDVTVIDGTSHQVVATFPVGHRPRGIRASTDGKTLYVALSGSPIAPPGVDEDALPPPDPSQDGIAVVDVASRSVARVLKGIANPEQLAIGADGMVYSASEATETLDAVDSKTGDVAWMVPVGREPEGVALTPDGKFLYVTAQSDNTITVIDTATHQAVKTLPVGMRPRGIAFTPDGARAYVTGEVGGNVTVIDARHHALLNTIRLTGEGLLPMGIAVSPDGKTVFVTTGRGGQLIALDAASSTQKSVKVGQRPWGIAVSPDGKTVYTANGPSHDVSVVDGASLTVLATLGAGQRPWGAAMVPKP